MIIDQLTLTQQESMFTWQYHIGECTTSGVVMTMKRIEIQNVTI